MAATLPASDYLHPGPFGPGSSPDSTAGPKALREEGKIRSDMKDRPPVARRASPWVDTLFSVLAHGAAWLTLALLAGILVSLVIGAAPAIRAYGLSFLWTGSHSLVQWNERP